MNVSIALELIIAMSMLFVFKHFVCDFLLQTPYMLGKSKPVDWVKPLAAHCAVHVAGTYVILALMAAYVAIAYAPLYERMVDNTAPLFVVLLLLSEFVIHFVMDRVKASPNMWGRWGPSDKNFWVALGFDQAVHALTYIVMVYAWFSQIFIW